MKAHSEYLTVTEPSLSRLIESEWFATVLSDHEILLGKRVKNMRHIVKVQIVRSLPIVYSPIGVIHGIDEVGDVPLIRWLTRSGCHFSLACSSTPITSQSFLKVRRPLRRSFERFLLRDNGCRGRTGHRLPARADLGQARTHVDIWNDLDKIERLQ